MKEEIYKKSFERYFTVKYKDHSSILHSHEGGDYKHPLFIKEESYNREEDFVKNFANPLYSVYKEYLMIVVERNEHKVSIKVFQGYKQRREGRVWFKSNKNVDYISVNTITGDVYSGYIHSYQKKRKCSKVIRRNAFFTDPVHTFKSRIKNLLTYYTDKSYEESTLAFSEFMYLIDKRENFETLNFGERLLRFYFNKKGIKYSNNSSVYIHELYGSELKKILKKNDNKLVESVMIKHGLSGKKIRKALHYCNRLNIDLYKTVRETFGDDWLNQDDENIILDLLNQPQGTFKIPSQFKEFATKEELRRAYSLLKQVFIHQNLDGFSYNDHIRMYIELKLFGERDLKWMSQDNREEFRKEHLDWTDKLEHYKRGNYTRHYPQYMYEMISQPILENYYPVLLDTSSNYNEESSFQSNCVKGYIGKPSCLIVSVRNIETEERATIEYRLTLNGNLVSADRVQSLGKFNQKLEDHWTPVLLKLDEKVLSCVRDKKYETVKLTKECKNGTILNSDTYWNDSGLLRWTFNNIESNTSLFNHFDF